MRTRFGRDFAERIGVGFGRADLTGRFALGPLGGLGGSLLAQLGSFGRWSLGRVARLKQCYLFHIFRWSTSIFAFGTAVLAVNAGLQAIASEMSA